MAHSLDRTVVAEGVETATAMDLLRERGCYIAQGYYISRPIPFRDLIETVSKEAERLVG